MYYVEAGVKQNVLSAAGWSIQQYILSSRRWKFQTFFNI